LFTFLLALISAICWGIAPAFGKIGLRGIHPMDGLAARTLITVFLVGTWASFSGSIWRIPTISARAWWFLALEAFFATFAGDLAYYAAIKWGNIGETAIILSVSPLITLWIGWWFMGENMSFTKIVGALCVIVGLILIGYNSDLR